MSEAYSPPQKKEKLLNIIGQVINEELVIENPHGKELEIKEAKNGQILTILDATHKKYCCITLDQDKTEKNDKILPFLNSNVKKITKKCDAILFYEREQVLYVIVIELKQMEDDNNNDNTRDKHISNAKNQIFSGKLFSQYLLGIANLYFRNKFIKIPTIFVGVIALQQKSTPKGFALKNAENHRNFPIFLYGKPEIRISAIINEIKRNPKLANLTPTNIGDE